MNKQWIEWLEEHTQWDYDEKHEYFYEWIGAGFEDVIREVPPESLQGWQIRFAEECGYSIEIFHGKLNNDNVAWNYFIISTKGYDCHEKHGFKTYLEAFNSAWEKFLELQGESL